MSMLFGDGLNGVLLLSENHEEEQHWMLKRLIRRAGFHPEQFFLGRLEGSTLMEAQDRGVKVVMPLGEKPLRLLTKEVGIERWRGRVLDNLGHGFLTLPTYKPSRLLHRRQPPERENRDPEILLNPPRYQRHWLRDLHYAVHLAQHGWPGRRPVNYLLDPSQMEFERWADDYFTALSKNPSLILSTDIETPYKKKETDEVEMEEAEAASELNKQVIRISFSYEEGTGVSGAWVGANISIARELLKAKGIKLGWNGLYFDLPVLEEHNDTPVNGMFHDGMDAYHFLRPQLPRGLEAVSADATDVLPWKHLSDAQPAWYSAADSDVALRNFNWTAAKLIEQGAWDNYNTLAREVMTYLKAAGRRGNMIDRVKQAELREKFDHDDDEVEAKIQIAVPEEFKPRHHYKTPPEVEILHVHADDTSGVGRYVARDGRVFEAAFAAADIRVCSHCGIALDGPISDHLKGRSKPTKKDPTFNACKAAGAKAIKQPGTRVEFDEILPFNANSSDQLIRYMKAHGHPVGRNKDDPDGESADVKHLEALVKQYGKEKFPIYQLAIDKHKVSKAKSTYLPVPDEFSLIHTTYKNVPWTWRLSSAALNLQNWGKRNSNPYAKEARMQIISRPGKRFIQADSTSIEAVMQGWYMGDEHYIWLANQSIHAWLATKKLGLPFNLDMVEKVRREHGSMYDGMKVANYTINFGGSPYAMFMANKDLFPTYEHAEETTATIFRLIPTLEAYQYTMRYNAQKTTYWMSPWNVRFDFFDVFTYDRDKRTGQLRYTKTGRPKLKLGKDGKAIVATPPQHGNGMFARENLVIIGQSEWADKMPANVTVHDGYMLEVEPKDEDRAREFLVETLTRPIPQLGGLRVGAAVEIGNNWASFHETKNPGGMKEVQKVTIEKQDFTYLPPAARFPHEMLEKAA